MFRIDSGSAIRDIGFGDIPYSMKITNTSTNPAVRTNVELPAPGVAGQFAIGTTWTVSFYARKSAGTGNAAVYLAFTDPGTGNATTVVSELNIGTVSTVWQRFKWTFTVAASPVSTNQTLQVTPYVATGATTGDTWIAGVQLEEGTSATTFTTATGNVALEEILCRRYFYILDAVHGRINLPGIFVDTTNLRATLYHPVPMRAAPGVTFSGSFRYIPGGATSTLGFIESTKNSVVITSTGATSTTGFSFLIQSGDSGDGKILVSAEL
jgi:hypothetical protein